MTGATTMTEDRQRELAGAAERAAGGSSGRDRRSPPTWWRPALAAAVLVIVLEGALLAAIVVQEGGFETLAAPRSRGAVLEVTFAPEATESAMREVLQGVSGRVVDGPSAIGVWSVRLSVPDDDRAAVEAAVDRLSARTDVVSHVARD